MGLLPVRWYNKPNISYATRLVSGVPNGLWKVSPTGDRAGYLGVGHKSYAQNKLELFCH